MERNQIVIRWSVLLALATLSLADSCPVRAEGLYTEIRPQERVRLSTPGRFERPVVGSLLRVHGDTLEVSQNGQTAQVPLARVSKFQISEGKKRCTGRGAQIGFMMLAPVGAIAELTYDSDATGGLKAAYVIVSGLAIGGFGFLLGGIIGTVATEEKWTEVPLTTLRISETQVEGPVPPRTEPAAGD